MPEASFVAQGDRDARLVHRTESFSDLVIGFSVALLSMTLVIPEHTAQLLSNPRWLLIYVWTFFVIVIVWLLHQRLFASYFVPRALPMTLNFLMLAVLGLLSFDVQVFGRVHEPVDRNQALILYFVLLGALYACIGGMYAYGVRVRWPLLSAEERSRGIKIAYRVLSGAAGVVAGTAVTALTPGHSFVPLAVTVVLFVLAGRLTARRIEARIVHV